jgi:hypothetical protein
MCERSHIVPIKSLVCLPSGSAYLYGERLYGAHIAQPTNLAGKCWSSPTNSLGVFSIIGLRTIRECP